MTSILITGGCGFVGSGLALALKQNYPQYNIIAFDNLKRRGSELNLPRLKKAGVTFIHGDIRNKSDLEAVPAVNAIIDAAAEPSVLAGLNEAPDYLVQTNFNGTVHCLELANKYQSDFIFLSTSRIYPIAQLEKIQYQENTTRFLVNPQQHIPGVTSAGISESFPLEGSRSLYGATKLASELMVQEYQALMGIRTVINRCGVITGPWQMGKVDQGVVVLWMARHFWQGKLGYFGYGGTGKQVRDILHIEDLYRLVDWQLHNMNVINGELFNVGGGVSCSVSLAELTALCQHITGHHITIDPIKENRQADIPIYLTDHQKVTKLTGWKPKFTPEAILQDIYEWIVKEQQDLKSILN